MNYKNRFHSRRQFLVGAGQTLLLPPLLSLMPQQLAAQTVSGRAKRVILVHVPYGAEPNRFYPAMDGQTMQAAADAPLYTSPMSSLPSGISATFGAAWNDATIRSKMNLFQGLDMCTGETSHTHGSFAGTSRNSTGLNYDRQPDYGTSMDNLIAKSPNFAGRNCPLPVLRMGTGEVSDWYSFTRSGGIGTAQYQSFTHGDKAIFNKAFANVGTTAPAGGGLSQSDQDKLSIADKVYADLTTLQNHKRISANDKVLLDRYVSSISDLQKKINANVMLPPPSCAKPSLTLQVKQEGGYYDFPATFGITSVNAMYSNYAQIIRSVFLCDLSRVIFFSSDCMQDKPSLDNADYHSHDLTRVTSMQSWVLDKVFNLAKLLDATPDPLSTSGTLLDNCVIIFASEHGGIDSHMTYSMPSFTIGSAGGYFKTGYYIDARQRPLNKLGNGYYTGRPQNQLFISVMQSMGLQPADYMSSGDGGFGEFNNFGSLYSKFTNTRNEPLPFIKA